MSGHSKWSKIKLKKGANDVKRGALFTRIGNQLAVAARANPDPDLNPGLAAVIEKAKAANLPLSNIERAIKRASDKDAAQLEEVLYEGYGPSGVAIMVECATDNKNRTYPEVKHAFTKNGGSMGEAGSVAFQFERKGVIVVEASDNKTQRDESLLAILDAGAIDAVEELGDSTAGEATIIAFTEPKELHEVKANINKAGLKTQSAELSYEPLNTIEVDDDTQAKLDKIIDALEDQRDVVAISHNGQ